MDRTSWWLAASLSLACAREDGSSHAGETPAAAPASAPTNVPDGSTRDREHASAAPEAAADDGGADGAAANGGADGPAADGGADDGVDGGADGAAAGETASGTAPELTARPMREVELRADDGTTIFGRYYPVTGAPRPIVLLFHQAGSNAAEYEPIAPRLQALGYAALAIDQRSGGRRFGRDNRTVSERGDSTGYSAAYADLEAALAWARQQGHPRVLAWGSSYSAALVFRLGAEHGDELAAVLAFSPGEYLGKKGTVAGWARECTMPVFVTSAPGEAEEAGAIAEAAGGRAEQLVPTRGVHGSSMLRPDRNEKGYEAIWAEVEAFLRRVVP